MTKTQMPEPFAYAHPHAEKGPLFTTTHMESYADARVREALEEAAEIADSMNAFPVYDAIRALIPKE